MNIKIDDELQERIKQRRARERRSRLLIIFFVVFLGLSLTEIPSLIGQLLVPYEPSLGVLTVQTITYLPVLITGGFLFSEYLQGKNDIFNIFGTAVQSLRGTGNSELSSVGFYEEVELINDRIVRLELFREGIDPDGVDLSESISNKIKRMPYKDLIQALTDSLNKSIRFEDIPKYTNTMEMNLKEYQISNGRQLANNLLFGTASAFVSIGAAVVLINSKGPVGEAMSGLDIASYYVPWITLIIVIQFISYFFLRLYSKNIETERYLRNELTNILSIKASIAMAPYVNDDQTTKDVISALQRTERNRFMNKDQTTVDLEEKRIESQGNISMFEKSMELAKEMASKGLDNTSRND